MDPAVGNPVDLLDSEQRGPPPGEGGGPRRHRVGLEYRTSAPVLVLVGGCLALDGLSLGDQT